MARKKKAVTETELNPAEIADHMAKLRAERLAIESLYKMLSEQLLKVLKEEGRQREGIFIIKEKQTLKITDDAKAVEWAQDKNVYKIDTAKAMRVIRRQLEIPEGFKIEKTNYISVSGASEREE